MKQLQIVKNNQQFPLKRQLKSNIVLLIGLVLPMISFGLDSDKTKPAQIISETATYDLKAGVTVYRGNVKIDQGTTHVTGDIVYIYNQPHSNQIAKMIAIGNLAHYNTLPDLLKPELQAQALTITYYPLTNKVFLDGNGVITQGNDSFAGPKIEYQIEKRVIISAASQTSQTVIQIEPQNQPSKN